MISKLLSNCAFSPCQQGRRQKIGLLTYKTLIIMGYFRTLKVAAMQCHRRVAGTTIWTQFRGF